jgi:hypothetical protein
MLLDIKSVRAAQSLVDAHGSAAAWDEAVVQLFEMKRLGDTAQIEAWRRIVLAIDAISDLDDPTALRH